MDNLDLLLRELNKAVEDKKPILVSILKPGQLKIHSEFCPTSITYNGWLRIDCKNNESVNFYIDDYFLNLDSSSGVLTFVAKNQDESIGICF